MPGEAGTVRIERLGHLGEGIAEGPVYVPRTLPGEIVEGEIAGGRLAAPKIVTPSPDRVRPPCRHYRSCGGCGLMHASDAFLDRWKREVVRTALAARGIDAEIAEPEVSPPGTRRRATLSGRRLRSGPVVGFHAPGSDTVTAIPGCHLLVPGLLAALPACAEITTLLGSRKGEVRLALTASEAGTDLAVSGTRALAGPDRAALARIADVHDLARLAVDGEVVVTRRPPVQSFGGIAVVPPPGAFLQATPEGEAALRRAVLAGLGPAARVADLFAGCGTFALPVAARAATHAVEADPTLLAALDAGWRRATGLKPVGTEVRDLFRRPLDPEDLARFDAVVIDPPRAGAEAQMRAIARSRVPTVVSVSCNPVTFARDAAILSEAGFAVGPVTIVDQFRWSPHLELAATFTRSRAPA